MNESNQSYASGTKNYGRTKKVYAQFHKLGWFPKFCNERQEEIETQKKAQIIYAQFDRMMLVLKKQISEYGFLKDR